VLGHDPVGVTHQLGHGELAWPVIAGREPLDNLGGDLDGAAVELGLRAGQLGHVPRLGVLGEEQLQQAEAADLRGLVGGLGQPAGERGPALAGDPVAAPPPAGVLAFLGQQPQAGQALGLGVDLAVGERPEVGHAAADGGLEGVRGRGAVPGNQPEDDVGDGGEVRS